MDNGQGLILEVFNQAGSLVAQSEIGKNTVDLKGLQAGQAVKDGEYTVAYTDGKIIGETAKVPAFTVPAGK